MNNIAIKLVNIKKTYTLSYKKSLLLSNLFGPDRDIEKIQPLNGVDLSVRKGERVGIIGVNGAGKTTLMKIISGIVTPDSGEVEIHGKVVSLIHIEAGFHPELTGEENIRLNGLFVGMDSHEVKRKKDEIVDFSDIGKFIKAPLYTYSDGMKFRLAFSVAVASNCDILLFDEIFTSGDLQFQQKSLNKLRSFQRLSKQITMIMCSHISSFIWNFADVYYELINGRIQIKEPAEMKKDVEKEGKIWSKIYNKMS